ncbi:MAG: sodium:alanine symporter family protein [Oscillibacter sp.]|nr:sodium:alanine symporter family protein [Oscillibacter sp.]
MIFDFIGTIDDYVWSYIAPFLILGFGLFATIAFKFPWIRYFKKMFTNMFSKAQGDGASPFGTLCAALGGQIGTGNVVGVATAIASGGPGALFWMWATALVGMSTSLCETILSQLFKQKNADGTYRGGGIYNIHYGLHIKWLAVILAITFALGSGMADCMTCVNGIYQSINTVMPVNPWIIGGILAVVAGAIVCGGFKRIARFSESVVPFMALSYLLVSLFILITNFKLLPAMFGMIFSSAFNFRSVGGGVLGFTVAQAFRYGMARGIFSNEAGMGTTSCIHASSSPVHPAVQGTLGMCGVFVDTILVCSATGLVILLSGAWQGSEGGAGLTQAAFGTYVGAAAAPIYIAVALFFFAFTSLVASFYTGRVAVQYLFGDRKNVLLIYLCIQMFMSALGATLSADNVFLIVDMTNGLMIIPNVIAMFLLFPKAKACFMDYETQLRNGIKAPVFDWKTFRKENNLEEI